MGKGEGGGRGKGGCECCETVHALACCLCLILFGGPILIAVGATLIAAGNRNERARAVDAVQAALTTWNDASSPNGWQQFQKLEVFANITPTRQSCSPINVKLEPNTDKTDRYVDEERRFGSVQQLRLTAQLDYNFFSKCYPNVKLTQQLAGGGGNVSLVNLPFMATNTLDYSILLEKAGGPRNCASRNDGCFTSNADNCKYNCENYFGGKWRCNSGNYQCSLSQAYFTSLAVKVSYQNQNNGYQVDNSTPGLGGGGNVLPAGFVRQYDTAILPDTVSTGPRFQVPNVLLMSATGNRPLPLTFYITVRSAADPWLSYMKATDGSGQFGATKSSLMATGVTLVVVGCLGTLFWLVAAFYAWWMLCSRRKPTARPPGVSGYAWDLANRYGGSYAPALGVPVHGTGQDGMPTAQPLYVLQGPYANQQVPGQPVPGYPPYSYPPPYGAPQPGPYPPYQYSAPYPPPPGGNVEMNQFSNGQPPMYGYPQPPPGAGSHDAQAAPGLAPYPYPYQYPYPSYGTPAPGAPQPLGAPQPNPANGVATPPSAVNVSSPPAPAPTGAHS